jgi:hypothetical protein
LHCPKVDGKEIAPERNACGLSQRIGAEEGRASYFNRRDGGNTRACRDDWGDENRQGNDGDAEPAHACTPSSVQAGR